MVSDLVKVPGGKRRTKTVSVMEVEDIISWDPSTAGYNFFTYKVSYCWCLSVFKFNRNLIQEYTLENVYVFVIKSF